MRNWDIYLDEYEEYGWMKDGGVIFYAEEEYFYTLVQDFEHVLQRDKEGYGWSFRKPKQLVLPWEFLIYEDSVS